MTRRKPLKLLTKYIVVDGNPVTGFDHYGPFDTPEEAVKYAQDEMETDWWIAPLQPIAPV